MVLLHQNARTDTQAIRLHSCVHHVVGTALVALRAMSVIRRRGRYVFAWDLLFYAELQSTYHKYKKHQHDYPNCRRYGVKQHSNEEFLGQYGKGKRNIYGNILSIFLQDHRLFLSNTAFLHPKRHRTTWSGKIQDKIYYNQIDYIIMKASQKSVLVNARSFVNSRFLSDHKIVISTFDLSYTYCFTHNRKAVE